MLFYFFKNSRFLLIALICLTTIQAQDFIRSEKEKFKIRVLAEGLQTPWGMEKLPDDRFLITERPGRLRILTEQGLDPEPVKGIPEVFAQGQGGLLDIKLHPQYRENGWIYLAYSDSQNGKSHTKIIRGKLKDHQWTDSETVYEVPLKEYTANGVHFGCRLVFDHQGFLYFGIGDRGEMKEAQNRSKAQGKIHRIHDDGRIPTDNPFTDDPIALKSIWAYGVRNPQGLFFDQETDLLWETEHGPQGGDELNQIQKGHNYGWPLVCYGVNYGGKPISDRQEMEGVTNPITYWVPSIAVSSVLLYRGNQFYQWKESLFVVSLAKQQFLRLEVENGKVRHQEKIWEMKGRIRDIRSFEDGYIYLVMNDPGQILQLIPFNP